MSDYKFNYIPSFKEFKRRLPTTVKNHKIATHIHRIYVKWYLANKDLLPKVKGKMFRRAAKRRLQLGRA